MFFLGFLLTLFKYTAELLDLGFTIVSSQVGGGMAKIDDSDALVVNQDVVGAYVAV